MGFMDTFMPGWVAQAQRPGEESALNMLLGALRVKAMQEELNNAPLRQRLLQSQATLAEGTTPSQIILADANARRAVSGAHVDKQTAEDRIAQVKIALQIANENHTRWKNENKFHPKTLELQNEALGYQVGEAKARSPYVNQVAKAHADAATAEASGKMFENRIQENPAELGKLYQELQKVAGDAKDVTVGTRTANISTPRVDPTSAFLGTLLAGANGGNSPPAGGKGRAPATPQEQEIVRRAQSGNQAMIAAAKQRGLAF